MRKNLDPRPHLSDFTFHSNGSTNEPRSFTFGPHSMYWLKKLEDHIKYRQINQFVHIINGTTTVDQRLTFNAIPVNPFDTIPIHYIANLKFDNPNAIPFLIDNLKKLKEYGLSTCPNNWLCLLADTTFRQFLKDSNLTSAITTSWEPFFKNPPETIHFNDNMINWTTCMNFYTCPVGTKHFLPTFVPTKDGIINLINLCQPASCPIDDLMTIDETVSHCDCGKNYRQFSFIPHIATIIRDNRNKVVYVPELANQLVARYVNLQFIQIEQNLDVLYILAEGKLDEHLIRNHFTTHDFIVNFICDKYFQIGAKLPVFSRLNQPASYHDYKRSPKLTNKNRIRFL